MQPGCAFVQCMQGDIGSMQNGHVGLPLLLANPTWSTNKAHHQVDLSEYSSYLPLCNTHSPYR